MGKKGIPLLIFIISILAFLVCSGCGDCDSPEQKAKVSLSKYSQTNVYDVLEAYPALNSFFNNDNLEISIFEQKLFSDLLGDDKAADFVVELLDLFPDLINVGATTDITMFSTGVQKEMRGKGPVPDLMSAIAVLTKSIVNVEPEKMVPFYDYLGKLDEMENNEPEFPEFTDYLINIFRKVIDFLETLDSEAVNLFMNMTISDFVECKNPVDGKLDFSDYEELIEKFSQKAPGGVSKILQGIKTVFYDKELNDEFANLLHAIGEFMGDKQSYALIKSLIENIHKKYKTEELGELLDRIWNMGPRVGPKVEAMEIEGYGKSGSAAEAVKDFFTMDKEFFNQIFEAMYAFLQEGYSFDKVDDQLRYFVDVDTFFFDRSGEGEYGDGKFYEPRNNFSYKNFSCLRGFVGLARRWSIPTNLTTTLITEDPNAEITTKFLRALFPNADEITFASCIWAERYEKSDAYYMGHGKPVTEKRGYGMMIDGVFVDPVGPAILTGGTIAFNMIGDSIINGPYDNIYDNVIWWYAKRKLYIVIDMIQFLPEIPALNAILGPFFKSLGIKSVPVILLEGTFKSVFYLELRELLEKLPEAMTQSLIKMNTPEWMVNMAIDIVDAYLPLGYPEEGIDRLYLLPPDYRDLDILVPGFAYCDPNAFNMDRFLNLENYEEFSNFYDVRDYTYARNKESVNHLLDVLAPVIVGMYKAYHHIVDNYPSTLQAVAERQAAARKSFSGAIHPCDTLLNIIAALSEGASEESVYSLPEEDTMPLIRLIEPLIQMESKGVLDSVLKISALLGKPELKDARLKIIEGLGEVIQTIEDNSRSPYTWANEILEIAEKALSEPKRWDALKLMMSVFENIFSRNSELQVVDDIVGLVNHLTAVDIMDEEWALAVDAIVEIFEKCTDQRVFTRAAIQLTTILETIDQKQLWNDALYVLDKAFIPGGVASYVLCGLERNTDYSWLEIWDDIDQFFHSGLMLDYDEGTFWKDIYYFLDFLAGRRE